MPQTLSLGISPCPNDTFIFDALLHGKIDTGGLEFRLFMEDVETLNQWALEGKLDVTKLSFGTYPRVTEFYRLLDAGSALGNAVGPLLIAGSALDEASLKQSIVAIPGEHTTAHRLFQMAYPAVQKKVFLRYDNIEDYVLSGQGPGVIIHENRFTYRQKGLLLLKDLGAYWEAATGLPIPLGGIVAKKHLDPRLAEGLSAAIRSSIEYAWSRWPELSPFVRANAREMDEAVMRSHIELYVNEFSLSLGEAGRSAVNRFLAL